MRFVRVRAGIVTALVGGLMWTGTQLASAHESREVDRFTVVVGFHTEPAYTHIPNGVDLAIRETESEEPFEELGDTLQVDVTFGDETFSPELRPRFGEPGRYRADFVPTRPGQWTFRFHGTIDDVEVDETFVSGPDTFDDVHDLAEASFPAQDPSTGELAERLDREIARLGDGAGTEEAAADAAEPEAASGNPASDNLARGLSAVALLLGLAALGAALALGRRRS